ncbi:MAG: transglutaminase domain-containing protein [Oscillospiraceae bacterium]|nr:transglutaminase domain-containing protein [Oscillospiraceae bacterium]
MKKSIAILLVLLMVFSLAACVDDTASEAAVSPALIEQPIPTAELAEPETTAKQILKADHFDAEDLTVINKVEEEKPVFENGFTTGDRDLDLALQQIIEENTTADDSFEDNLHNLYRHVRDNYKYRKMSLHNAENLGEWLFDNVRIMVDEGRGNCYSYAGLLYCLFRAYGFDEAEMCVGTFCKSPHGWVQAEIDGTEYIFDVETEYASLTRGRMPDHYVDCFFKTHQQLKAYSYHLEGADQP